MPITTNLVRIDDQYINMDCVKFVAVRAEEIDFFFTDGTTQTFSGDSIHHHAIASWLESISANIGRRIGESGRIPRGN
ncbi:MAG: hypothetical protein AAF649_00880 [Verrucomicrobiota bacterium]